MYSVSLALNGALGSTARLWWGGAKARIAIMPLCGIRCDCVAERDFLVDSIKESATTKISRYECRMSFLL